MDFIMGLLFIMLFMAGFSSMSWRSVSGSSSICCIMPSYCGSSSSSSILSGSTALEMALMYCGWLTIE